MKEINQDSTYNLPRKKRRIFGNRIKDENTIYGGEYEYVDEEKHEEANQNKPKKKANTTLLKLAVGAFALGTILMGVKDCYNTYFKPKVSTPNPAPVVSQYTPTCSPCPTQTATKTLEAKVTSTRTNPISTKTATRTYVPTKTATRTPEPTPIPTSTQDSAEVILYTESNYQGISLKGKNVRAGINLPDLGNVKDKKSGDIKNFDNNISSIQINGDYIVELYTEKNYRGNVATVSKSKIQLPAGWDNTVSSCKIIPKTSVSASIPTKTSVPNKISEKGKLKVNGLEYEVTFSEDKYGITFTRGNYSYSPSILNKGSTKGTKYSSMNTDFGDRWEINYTAPDGTIKNKFLKYNSKEGLSFPVITTPNGEEYIVFQTPKEILGNGKNVWFDYQTSANGQSMLSKVDSKEMQNFMLCPADFELSKDSIANNNYTITDPNPEDNYTFCIPVAKESL